MNSTQLGTACIDMLMSIVSSCLTWFSAIFKATGLRNFWIGVVILVALMSIVIVPMRSGQLLGGGAISTFARSKINNKNKRSNTHHDGDD